MNPLLEETQFTRFLDVTKADVNEVREITLKEIEEFKSKIFNNPKIDPNTFIAELSNFHAHLSERDYLLSVFNNVIRHYPLHYLINQTRNLIQQKIKDLFASELIVKPLKKIKDSPEFAEFDEKQIRIYYRLLSFCPIISFDAITKQSLQKHQTTMDENYHLFSVHYGNLIENLSWNLSEDTNLSGMSVFFIDRWKAEAQKVNRQGYVVSGRYFNDIVHHASRSALRKQAHEFITNAVNQHNNSSNNLSQVIKNIIVSRNQIAKLNGFETYVDMRVADLKLNSSKQIKKFLLELLIPSQNCLNTILEEIKDFAKSEGNNQPLQPWDLYYYRNLLIHRNFPLLINYSHYFRFESVFKGIIALVHSYYGVIIQEMHNSSVWIDDVRRFVVKNKDNKILGYIEFDPYIRPTKINSTFATGYKRRSLKQNNTENLPMAIICINYIKPDKNEQTYLTPDHIAVLLHEFGHALHQILILENNPILSQYSETQFDWVEFPSKLLEHFVNDFTFLKSIGRHYSTNEPIPDEMIEQIQKSRIYYLFDDVSNIVNSLFDNYIYNADLTGDIDDWIIKFKQELGISFVLSEYMIKRSLNLLISAGYSGYHYVYQFADMHAADAFNLIQKSTNPEQKFKDLIEKVLSPGIGCRFTEECYYKYFNKNVTLTPLLEKYEIINRKPIEQETKKLTTEIVTNVTQYPLFQPAFQSYRYAQFPPVWNRQPSLMYPVQTQCQAIRFIQRVTK